MTALAEKVEALSGPSQEVDRLVAQQAGWFRVAPRFTNNRHGGWIAPVDFLGADPDGRPRLDSLHGTTIYRDPPRYTASVDAVLALIAEKLPQAAFDLRRRQHEGPTRWSAKWLIEGRHWRISDGATPALALLAAFLRAMEALREAREALAAFNLKEDMIVGGSADSLTLRVPLNVIRGMHAALSRIDAILKENDNGQR
jgi:hypothetical protein